MLPVGRIDYLSFGGIVQESVEYFDEEKFKATVKDENYYGVPMELVFYEYDGKSISRSFVKELDTPPQRAYSVPYSYTGNLIPEGD